MSDKLQQLIAGMAKFVPDEVKPFEMAARIYMKKIGADPDALIPQPHPTLANIDVRVPAWCFVAQELIDMSMRLSSIREASEVTKGKAQ